MISNFTGVTFAEQRVTPADDAQIRRAILPDGILSGCELSYSGSTLTMAAGSLIACGRQFRHPAAQNWAVVDATSGYARLLLTIDLTKTATADAFDQVTDTIEYASAEDGFPELIREDINGTGTKYQMVACVVSLGTGGITGIVSQLAAASITEILANFRTGVEMDLLWENASPGSAFAAQTIAVDLTGYDLILIVFLGMKDTYSSTHGIIPKEHSGETKQFAAVRYDSGVHAYLRSVTADFALGTIAFEGGLQNATANDGRIIPQYIYGIKGVNA